MNKHYFLLIILSLFSGIFIYAQENNPIPSSCQQTILVVTASADANTGTMYYFERRNSVSKWESTLEISQVAIGKNGLAWGRGLHKEGSPKGFPIKKEGDGKSPAGIFSLSSIFGYQSEAEWGGFKMPYLRLNEMIECIDDASSQNYNSIVSNDTMEIDWSSSEKMASMGIFYKLGVTVDHNKNPMENGAGSCIFIHNWKSPFGTTAGCTAMDSDNMKKTAFWLDADKSPLLIQLTEAQYSNLKNKWLLPDISF